MKFCCIIMFLTFINFHSCSPVEPRGVLQAVAVVGKFFCGNEPVVGVTVKLIDVDYGNDPDDLMDETRTDVNGSFLLTGGAYESTKLEPALKIYHDCNDGHRKCQKRLYWTIPDEYVSRDVDNIKMFNIGVVNLQISFGNEKRDCRH